MVASMDEKRHEPKIIGEAKNLVAHIVMRGIIFGLIILIFCGLFAPAFWGKIMEHENKEARRITGTEKDYKKEMRKSKRMWFVICTVWFLFSWMFYLSIFIPGPFKSMVEAINLWMSPFIRWQMNLEP